VTGIAGLAVVDDANLHCDSVGCSRKKIAEKKISCNGKTQDSIGIQKKIPGKRLQKNLDPKKTFRGIISKMMNEYPVFFERKNNLK
jgi:hypothetical protein